MQADSLLDALKINPEKYRVIAVVGGGGKTSLIFRLMEELVSIGKTVIVHLWKMEILTGFGRTCRYITIR